MSTDTINTDIQSDLEAICASIAAHLPVDPVIARRVQERSELLRKALPETNIAVELVREVRDEQ